jgi:phosphonatase-like hydrolase
VKVRAIDLVIFDIMGTTVEDRDLVAPTFADVLARHGIALDAEQLGAVRGLSKRDAITRLVGARAAQGEAAEGGRVETVYRDFREELQRRYRDAGVSAVPGAGESFERLRAQGIAVALNTGLDRELTRFIVGELGWDDGRLSAVVCGDDVAQGRPAPYLLFRAMEQAGATSVRRVASVGDTTADLHAGWNAGMAWNVGVLSGAHGRERLEQAPHTHLLESVAELPALWE